MKFRIQVTLARLLLAATTLQIFLSNLPNQNQQHYVQCSSYLGDYFLPTAKLALNKIQQSLAPAHANGLSDGEPSTQLGVNDKTTKPISTNQMAHTERSQQQAPPATNLNDDNKAEKPKHLVQEEPNKNEFVKLDTGSGPVIDSAQPNEQGTVSAIPTSNQPSSAPQAQVVVEQQQAGSSMTASAELSEATAVVSSTAATDSDPTSTVASADPAAKSPADSGDQGISSVTGSGGVNSDRVDEQQTPSSSGSIETNSEQPSLVSVQDTETMASTTKSTTASSDDSANVPSEATTQQQPDRVASSAIESKSAEEAVKETELEAVAAVDASIGFGDPFASMSDPCFDEYGNARYCEPEFENAAFEKQVEVSSECGQPPSRFCTAYQNEHNDQIRNCHICDAQHPKKRHPASYLTDMNNSNNPTCWVSAPIQSPSTSSGTISTNSSGGSIGGGQSLANAAGAASATAGNLATPTADQAPPLKSDNVTLILNLDKKYEITYISMQFCSMKPDSLAIYKSMDYGRSWTPYQFYSSQCRRMYGRQSRSAATAHAQLSGQQRHNHNHNSGAEIEPSCLNTSQPAGGGSAASANSGRIAFSTLDGRQSSLSSLDRSQTLQDWITATDIKIVLDRHQAKWIHSNLVHAHHHQQQVSSSDKASAASLSNRSNSSVDSQASQRQTGNSGEQLENSLTNPSDTFNYAMSDLTVGGRCKCNGHASRCIHGKDGRLQCDCHHNTAGRDCEKCAPFHFDRPWARATQLDANPCQPCNCNGHSRKCRFDAELYRLSGKRSGGVCIGCRDNTAGRHCHYCKEGFTRDHSRPMNDKEACKHCDCHPIGSLGRVCNQTTGQCPCKEGVAGLQCNRCAPGYQQSSSLTEPCIKLPENDINYEPSLTVDGDEQSSIGAASTDNSQQPTLHQLNPPEQPTASTTNEASGGDSGAISDNSNNGDRESLLAHLSRTPPSGQARFKNNKQQPPTQSIDDEEQGLQEQDKDDYSEAGLGLSSVDGDFGLARKYNRPQAGDYWQHQQSRKPAYYPGGRQYQRARHQQFDLADPAPVALDEEEDLLTQPMHNLRPTASQEQDQDYPSSVALDSRYYYNNGGGGGGSYVGSNKPGRFTADSRYNRPRGHSRSRGGTPSNDLVPVANIDHGSVGDADSMLEDGADSSSVDPPSYQAPPMGSIYNEDNFNQIQAVPGSRIRGQQQSSRARHHHHQLLHHGNSNNRHRFSDSQIQADATSLQPPLSGNEIACAECQSGTRRLGFRQFCHLDYAIKATILYKFMAEDWTKFGVEIQDIFKSPAAIVSARSSYIADNTLQAEESQINGTNNRTSVINKAQAVGGSLLVDQLDTPKMGGLHRIKIGTVQTIWVPTEDVTCKCPGLKPSTTYLLMGSIDAKENSANSLQLDRHGIALEWKSSLQEKLIKYQRRHARGRC